MYAIIDIETTGGKFNQEGITEIAIYKFDGHQVVDQFISLVNPEIPIQPFVVKLTGINNKMLTNAPKFYELAKRILEITNDCVIVAHNASFDYRVLQMEFKRLGYQYTRKTLCTVELSKKLLPNQKSYSLGKLVRSLGIPISSRHRANGDAQATTKLFELLKSKDSKKEIIKKTIKSERKTIIPSRLLDIVEMCPETTGVYYIHNQKGTIIYIGKNKNIKKRVNQHFTDQNERSKKIQDEIFTITHEQTGSELIALLKHLEEVSQIKPIYNIKYKPSKLKWGIYPEQNANGFTSLILKKIDLRKKEVASFINFEHAKSYLIKITDKKHLCLKINELSNPPNNCLNFDIGHCFGACINKENATNYNKRVALFLNQKQLGNKNFIIVDKGRKVNERSAILIENGQLKGYCFYNLNFQIQNIEILKTLITPLNSNALTRNIIQNYLQKKRVIKIIEY